MKQDSFSKKYIKSHLGTVYSVARSIRNAVKDEKDKKASAKKDCATHSSSADEGDSLKMIFVTPSKNRLNLILTSLDEDALKRNRDILLIATEKANLNSYELRIITRNNLANPKLYRDLLNAYNVNSPKKVSFYTDWHERVSAPIYALEVTDGDVFFTAKDLNRLKEWGK
ncbi:hypothetical protein J6D24_00190 [Candidatus Saccharibacteria bacterium]|nr:hypothetical protein [Candidatus Saccharibacteria bacterium]